MWHWFSCVWGTLAFFPRSELRQHLALYTLHKTPTDGASPSGSPNMITSFEHFEHHPDPIMTQNIDHNTYSHIPHVPKGCSRGVMATRLTSNQKILGSTPSVSVFVNFSFSFSKLECLVQTAAPSQYQFFVLSMLVTGTECARAYTSLFLYGLFVCLTQVIRCVCVCYGQCARLYVAIYCFIVQNDEDSSSYSAGHTIFL